MKDLRESQFQKENELTMKADILYRLPIRSTGLIGDIETFFDGIEFRLIINYYSDELRQDVNVSLIFKDVLANRFRGVMQSRGYLSDSYCALVSVRHSSWIKELHAVEPDRLSTSVSQLTHYAIFIPDTGYFEIISSGYQTL